MKKAELIIGSADNNADLYYATRFDARGMDYIYFRTGGRKYLLLADLEMDRAKKAATVDTILSYAKYFRQAREKKSNPINLDAVIEVFKEKRVKKIIVPMSCPCYIADYLKKYGFKIEIRRTPFYIKRTKKTKDELREIVNAQKAVFSAMRLAEEMIKKSKIRKNRLYFTGKVLTSERLIEAIRAHLYNKGYETPFGIIASCGKYTEDPHYIGSGPLKPHRPIIVDIFPRSIKTKFWGDATRTFCKGRAPKELKKMYGVVLAAQKAAIKMIRHGANAKTIYKWIIRFFEKAGYPTGEIDGQRQGFFHGAGHGIGLELHEDPVNIKPFDHILKKGSVTSIEPGLYYKGLGGVRIEDLVYVTARGCKIIAGYPKQLEIR